MVFTLAIIINTRFVSLASFMNSHNVNASVDFVPIATHMIYFIFSSPWKNQLGKNVFAAIGANEKSMVSLYI